MPQICTGGVVNSKATYLLQPEFPKQAKDENVSGTVNVRVSIDEQGNVTSTEVCSGHPLLRDEAEKAALKAKFKPTFLADQPVKVGGIIVYKFPPNEEKRITGGIVNGKAINMPKPDYPQEAKDFCVGGVVEVRVLISEEGNVISAEAISGDELLRDSAVEAAKKTKFGITPDIMPIKVNGRLVYNFVPENKCIYAGVVNKKAIEIPKPNLSNIVHPKHLKSEEPTEIIVQIIIDPFSGNVVKARALTGHPLLQAPFSNSARKAKFRPTTYTGTPIFIRAILVYKVNSDGEVITNIEKDVAGIPVDLVKPPTPFCNCRFSDKSSIIVETEVDEDGNVTAAKAYNGHPILKNAGEKAALKSKFFPAHTKSKVIIIYEFEAVSNNREAKFIDVYVKEVKSDNTVMGKALNLPKTAVPSAFNGKLKSVEKVLVETIINEDGNVISAKPLSGHPVLKAACVAAARQSKFSQTTISGIPVKAKALLTYEYISTDELIVNVIVNSIEPQK